MIPGKCGHETHNRRELTYADLLPMPSVTRPPPAPRAPHQIVMVAIFLLSPVVDPLAVSGLQGPCLTLSQRSPFSNAPEHLFGLRVEDDAIIAWGRSLRGDASVFSARLDDLRGAVPPPLTLDSARSDLLTVRRVAPSVLEVVEQRPLRILRLDSLGQVLALSALPAADSAPPLAVTYNREHWLVLSRAGIETLELAAVLPDHPATSLVTTRWRPLTWGSRFYLASNVIVS